MSRELLSPDHPHHYTITLLLRSLTFHIFHSHRHKSATLETVRPSLLTLGWCHYQASPNTTEVAVLSPTDCPKGGTWSLTSYPLMPYVKQLNRLLLLVATTIPKNRPTREIEGNRVVTVVRSVLLRGKPRMGGILGNSFRVLSRGDKDKSWESLVT